MHCSANARRDRRPSRGPGESEFGEDQGNQAKEIIIITIIIIIIIKYLKKYDINLKPT